MPPLCPRCTLSHDSKISLEPWKRPSLLWYERHRTPAFTRILDTIRDCYRILFSVIVAHEMLSICRHVAPVPVESRKYRRRKTPIPLQIPGLNYFGDDNKFVLIIGPCVIRIVTPKCLYYITEFLFIVNVIHRFALVKLLHSRLWFRMKPSLIVVDTASIVSFLSA